MKKLNFKITTLFVAITFVAFSVTSCSNDDDTTNESGTSTGTTTSSSTDEDYSDNDFTATDWTEETHSKSADPNFEEIFDDTQVKRIDIVVTEARWQSMLDDMTDLYGTFGHSNSRTLSDTDEDPIMVPAEVFYNGKEWYRVGIRFKGNSSLQTAWQSGNMKLSLKLKFDEYEDEYPQIDNQRFYGFKKLSLKNNFNDKSFLREKVAADIFTDYGLAMSHTSFFTVYIDSGDGPVYFGLYTMVEEVDNTVIDTQFSSDKENLYKPDGDGASFVNGTFDEDDFEKKTNEDDADWTDIKALFTALNASNRTSAPATWRANLDAVIDTDIFLKYLAVNTVIQNWDTYGRMTHNYFLYNNPDTNKFNWIPWDNNEALETGNQGGSLNLDFSNISSGDWPLIEYLYNDSVYKAKYDAYVKEVIEGPFETSYIQSIYTKYASLVEPYATSEISGYTFLNSSSEFSSAVSTLKSHASSRASAVNSYLY